MRFQKGDIVELSPEDARCWRDAGLSIPAYGVCRGLWTDHPQLSDLYLIQWCAIPGRSHRPPSIMHATHIRLSPFNLTGVPDEIQAR